MNKNGLVEYLMQVVKEKMDTVEEAMNLAQQSANQETKSTAGDKYETARAMAQNERDMYARQLLQIKQDYNILQHLDLKKKSERVIPGSLVVTSFGTIFISVSIGLAQWQGAQIMVVSPVSPAGKAIIGKQCGDDFIFQGKPHKIHSVD